MSVCSGSEIVSDSISASTESKRHSSTRVACSEKIAKLTPTPSHVAPNGCGEPGQTRRLLLGTSHDRYHVNGCHGNHGLLAFRGRGLRGHGSPGTRIAQITCFSGRGSRGSRFP